MAFVCKFCICKDGLKEVDLPKHPQTWEAAAIHIEKEHRYLVVRHGETKLEAEGRFARNYHVLPRSAAEVLDWLAGTNWHYAAASAIEMAGPILIANPNDNLWKTVVALQRMGP